ncbi:uncharacterized protein MELLADRAFT_113045 [Melampsora larici-populina 98AG31]|uniref:Tc1-like transposase DDE domain-containing protein n=1 Tax=Melampsora larici-populina (strain 98AG31 / pathotype 3-4-7) TaxID=747676 RepID=F4S8L3_MELLP|nr:uncharacterized protein MELLADRAFT_113045 [Melampsora larici-populina 98AG31]EGF99051.1 hypothetical protein MELLADRAFT_113045 [Melampsora larici-populina 98AG31]
MPFVHYDTQIKSRHAEKKISGVSLADANRELMTNVCKRSTQRWQKILLETGSVIRDKATYLRTGPPYALNEHDLQLIFEILEEDSTLMLDEISDILEDLTEKKPCISTLQSTITKRLNYSLKKGQTVDPRQSEEQRAEYARRVANLPSQYLVFLDEVGVNERDVVCTHLRAPVGQRGHRLRRKREGEHWTLCGAICEQGFLAGAVVEVGFDREEQRPALQYTCESESVSSASIDQDRMARLNG